MDEITKEKTPKNETQMIAAKLAAVEVIKRANTIKLAAIINYILIVVLAGGLFFTPALWLGLTGGFAFNAYLVFTAVKEIRYLTEKYKLN